MSPGYTDPDEVRNLERAILTDALGQALAVWGRRRWYGAKLVARRLREDRCELALRVNAPADDAIRTATAVLANAGQPVDRLHELDPQNPGLSSAPAWADSTLP